RSGRRRSGAHLRAISVRLLSSSHPSPPLSLAPMGRADSVSDWSGLALRDGPPALLRVTTRRRITRPEFDRWFPSFATLLGPSRDEGEWRAEKRTLGLAAPTDHAEIDHVRPQIA